MDPLKFEKLTNDKYTLMCMYYLHKTLKSQSLESCERKPEGPINFPVPCSLLLCKGFDSKLASSSRVQELPSLRTSNPSNVWS